MGKGLSLLPLDKFLCLFSVLVVSGSKVIIIGLWHQLWFWSFNSGAKGSQLKP